MADGEVGSWRGAGEVTVTPGKSARAARAVEALMARHAELREVLDHVGHPASSLPGSRQLSLNDHDCENNGGSVLQTAEYARARFAESALLFGVPDDIDYAVRARMQPSTARVIRARASRR